MAGKMVNLRLGANLLKEIDAIVESDAFDSRTEFIKYALRKAIEERKRERIAKSLSVKTLFSGPNPEDLESIMESISKKAAERKHPSGVS
ncbi:MAG: ribbon-helix-helix domain-containing protein [Candidatus Diapherotrites archaeon]